MFEPGREVVTMIAAAREAGEVLLGHFRRPAGLAIGLKGRADFVTSADVESEAILRSALLRAHPDFGFVGEESATAADRARVEQARFVVDPLDGTSNFVHGIPHFAVAIALERGGKPVAGVVFDVPKGELFVGEEGRGAWLLASSNEAPRPLGVSDDSDLFRALVATGIPHAGRPERHDAYGRTLRATMREAAGIRRFAAAAIDLAYVAAGRFAAFYELGLARWDIAAGALLVQEAGGRVSEPDGGGNALESGDVLATNGRLHEPMAAMLAAALHG